MALTFCLMAGTAGLPHILIRYYTVPNPKAARVSVGWSLFFIFLLYFTAPAYAAFSRLEVLRNVVGQRISELPAWVANWTATGLHHDPRCSAFGNGDGILQFRELQIVGDIVVLATGDRRTPVHNRCSRRRRRPRGVPLDRGRLLLVIATAVSHDLYSKSSIQGLIRRALPR